MYPPCFTINNILFNWRQSESGDFYEKIDSCFYITYSLWIYSARPSKRVCSADCDTVFTINLSLCAQSAEANAFWQAGCNTLYCTLKGKTLNKQIYICRWLILKNNYCLMLTFLYVYILIKNKSRFSNYITQKPNTKHQKWWSVDPFERSKSIMT